MERDNLHQSPELRVRELSTGQGGCVEDGEDEEAESVGKDGVR